MLFSVLIWPWRLLHESKKLLQEEILLSVMGLAHQYVFKDLEVAISDYLKANLNSDNVCVIYDISCMYELKSLSQKCCEFMDRNATEIINSDAFLSLSSVSRLCDLCTRFTQPISSVCFRLFSFECTLLCFGLCRWLYKAWLLETRSAPEKSRSLKQSSAGKNPTWNRTSQVRIVVFTCMLYLIAV